MKIPRTWNLFRAYFLKGTSFKIPRGTEYCFLIKMTRYGWNGKVIVVVALDQRVVQSSSMWSCLHFPFPFSTFFSLWLGVTEFRRGVVRLGIRMQETQLAQDSILGSRAYSKGFVPFDLWLFGMHIAFQFQYYYVCIFTISVGLNSLVFDENIWEV